MVGMSMTFGNATYSTPHGGPPFHGWKNGFGFGHSAGAGNWHTDPSIPRKLRFVPEGDRGLASNPFWRTKSAIGLSSGFGIGDRPDNGDAKRAALLPGPDNYGDIGLVLRNTKRNATKSGITLKPHFPTIKDKYRDKALPSAGPGPAKYNTSYPTGVSSWVRPSKIGSATMQARPLGDLDLMKKMGLPGPDTYNVTVPAGTKAPSNKSTLYNISFKGRLAEDKAKMGAISPGPSRYTVRGEFDQYTLGTQIAMTKVPKDSPPLQRAHSSPVISKTSATDTLEPSAEFAYSTDTTAAPDSQWLSATPTKDGKRESSVDRKSSLEPLPA
eukprot:TRINITY_DN13442_c0_g2_i1.p1 TRINITY_DN13442_c0_g2~~TRINITY_DN13442_c0_g2_i1.p1  ORF type:complete len:327 (+),score=40.67 TRINITY_DN13442_c0_g2_i1:274-1254(+)